MTRDQISDGVIEQLDQQLMKLRGALSQECYQRDCFWLFEEAYRGGLLALDCPDNLREPAFSEIIVERWFADDGRNDEREKLMQAFLQRWDYWRYALDHYEA